MSNMINANYITGAESSYLQTYSGRGKERTDTSFTDKVTGKVSVSPEDMTLEEYKVYFNNKMNALYTHPSQKNYNDIIDITDAAYQRMKNDPEYEKKVLDGIAKNKAVNFGNYIPEVGYLHIDDTWEKCYGYTRGMKENDGYTKTSSSKNKNNTEREKKAKQKELLEEYLEKRAQAKKLQEKLLSEEAAESKFEHSRLLHSWNNKKQMSQVSSAYEANVIIESMENNVFWG